MEESESPIVKVPAAEEAARGAMSAKPYEYVKRTYGVNPEPGMRVTSQDGKHSGVIVRKRSEGCYVWVRRDGQNFSVPFHPLDLVYPEAS